MSDVFQKLFLRQITFYEPKSGHFAHSVAVHESSSFELNFNESSKGHVAAATITFPISGERMIFFWRVCVCRAWQYSGGGNLA